jgi:hypothetical protein
MSEKLSMEEINRRVAMSQAASDKRRIQNFNEKPHWSWYVALALIVIAFIFVLAYGIAYGIK